jgi:hypothetical protein
MSKPSKNLTKETLQSRLQISQYESKLKSVEIDSRTLARLISLGSVSTGQECFARLYGYLNIESNELHIKDCIALPCLPEDESQQLNKIELDEKNIRVNLGFNYQCVGTFVITQNEDTFGESICFYLSHFNVYGGFSVILIYSKETAKLTQTSPIKAYVLSDKLSEAYKYKMEKEFFEPDPNELSKMISENSEFLREIPIKTQISPVLELILKKHQHELRSNNEISLSSNSKADLITNLESGLTQTTHNMMNVLNSKRSLEMRRQHLLNFAGAIARTNQLITLKRQKLDKDSIKLNNLKSLANS